MLGDEIQSYVYPIILTQLIIGLLSMLSAVDEMK